MLIGGIAPCAMNFENGLTFDSFQKKSRYLKTLQIEKTGGGGALKLGERRYKIMSSLL